MLKHVPLCLLLAFVGRLLVFGASVGDAISICALAGLYGVMQVLEDRKAKPANQELMDRVAALEVEFKESKDKVSSLQMATGLRRNG